VGGAAHPQPQVRGRARLRRVDAAHEEQPGVQGQVERPHDRQPRLQGALTHLACSGECLAIKSLRPSHDPTECCAMPALHLLPAVVSEMHLPLMGKRAMSVGLPAGWYRVVMCARYRPSVVKA